MPFAAHPPADTGKRGFRPEAGDLPALFGRYRLERILGQGGMGAVYLARDMQLGRPVALKIPFLIGPGSTAGLDRFLREARAAAALSHPNICPVFDSGEVDGVPYITLAFIQGETLARRIDPARPFDPREAAALVRKVALAMDEAHRLGVVHRDLKPVNIMIDPRGEPVVMDFGLARLDAATALTQQGDIMGTPAYMPPEQVNGEVDAIGPASDVYSLGVVLYELLTGRTPFRGDLLALMSQITLDEPQPPSTHRPGLDPRLDAVCLRALAKRPADRCGSMRELAEALGRFLDAGPAPAGKEALLSLRVEGTPFAYRPAPGQDVITLGRQKRKAGEPSDVGNDVVLRVPGNDGLSARISRRHLEIHRSGGRFFVTDRSKGGTLRNGRLLVRDMATPLEAGDRLVVAGVVTLEVLLHADAPRGKTVAEARVPAAHGTAILETSLGDMVTVE